MSYVIKCHSVYIYKYHRHAHTQNFEVMLNIRPIAESPFTAATRRRQSIDVPPVDCN